MESFLIPLLIVVVVVVLGLLVVKYLGSRSKTENDGGTRGRPSRGPAAVASREESVRASARLNQQQHSAIYALLARGDALNAIMEYRKATGAKLREAATAVASMSTYPQAYRAPRAPSPDEGPDAGPGQAGDAGLPGRTGDTDGRGQAAEHAGPGQAGSPGAGPLGPPAHPTVPDNPESLAGAAPAPRPEAADSTVFAPRPKEATPGYRYRAIVSHGEEIREIASTRLNDDVFARIKDEALGGDRQAAVRLLMEHSDADEQQAQDFVRLIQPDPPAKPEG
jgi:hypothetical protein